MRLKYVGPRPEISFSCISFNTCKEDKFVYINPAYQLLKALQHDYERGNAYTDTVEPVQVGEDELETIKEALGVDVKTCVKHHQEKLLSLFDKEIKWIKDNRYMDAVSKESYLKNHNFMREYRLQRQVNKSVYYALLKKLAYTIKHKQIAYIVTPLHERFTYVLINIQKSLMQERTPLFTEIDIIREQGELKARLRLRYI